MDNRTAKSGKGSDQKRGKGRSAKGRAKGQGAEAPSSPAEGAGQAAPAAQAPTAVPATLGRVAPVSAVSAAPADAKPSAGTVTRLGPKLEPPRFLALIPNNLSFDYLRWRWWALGASWGVISVGVLMYFLWGLNYGIDFTGGTLIQVQVQEQAPIGELRDLLDKAGIGAFSLQALGESGHQDFLITLGKVGTDQPGQPAVSPAPPAGAAGGTPPPSGNAGAPAGATPPPSGPGAAPGSVSSGSAPALVAPGVAQTAPAPAPAGTEAATAAMHGRAEQVAQHVEQVLKQRFPTVTLRRVESVGPKAGRELRTAAISSVLLALGAILVYIWVRFQWRYSIGAIVATVHDVLIVLTALVLTQREFTLTVLAAVLTIAGYSVNDTVVVFDRIRENQRRQAKKDMGQVMNESINQTLSRTLLTSGLTLAVVVVMFFFGGEIIHDFAFAMLVGVLIGTYSSIFSASPVVYMLYKRFPPAIK